MADFTAVLRKTIDGLGETTPEIRTRVYDKARAAITKKLDAIDPPPAKAVRERQMKALEDAIAQIESDHAVADEPLDDLDRLLAESSSEKKASPRRTLSDTPPELIADDDGPQGAGEAKGMESLGRVKRKRKSRAGLWLLVIILLLAATAAAAWMRSDLVLQYTGVDIKALIAQPEPEAKPDEESMVKPEPDAPVVADKPEREPEPDSGRTGDGPAATSPDPASEKFTQRLMADGTEIDPGPASAEASVGEGRSVASAQSADSPETGSAPVETAKPENGTPQIVIGQKALLYEEGTGSDQGTADAGSVVWSVVKEAPSEGLPEEPAIRGELVIPEKDIRLSLTIRRNGDKTLPASHLVELYFQLPDGYGGGGIAEMTRISLKDSEQSTGSPLLGVPARISDEFYLVALTDAEAAVNTNLALLRRQSWIDVPVSYLSGRRALFTLEKGIPGEKVFNEVIKAWQDAGSG